MPVPTATPAEVRAALGVSTTELPDATVNLAHYDTLVMLDLESINTSAPTLYDTISALNPNSRTTAEQRYYDLVHLFCTYSRAKTLLAALPMFSVSRLTDGRAEFQRQPDILEDIVDGVKSMYGTIKEKLASQYLLLVPGSGVYVATLFDYTLSTGLAIDPVTAS